jgi:VanZ family protein
LDRAKLFAFLVIAARWLFWPALALIVWGELTPGVGLPIWDKAQHFLAYFGLAGLATTALRGRSFWAMLALIALGGALEILQGYTGRDPDIHDEIANAIGAVSGWLAGLGLQRLLVGGAPAD